MPGHWLMKTEPDVFSIDDLKAKKKAIWDGVRNYAARNFLRDQIKAGDGVFIYHSSCPEPGIAGVAKVAKGGFPDPSAFDKEHKYYDPKSDPEAPRWYSVEVAFEKKAKQLIPLAWLKEEQRDMAIFKWNRLSVTPVSPEQWKRLSTLPGHW